MNKKVRKFIVLLAKIAVAVGLLWLVARKVYWNDYAVSMTGEYVPVLPTTDSAAHPGQLFAKDSAGQGQWQGTQRFRPLYVTWEGKNASVQNAQPGWDHPQQYEIQRPDGQRLWLTSAQIDLKSAQYIARGLRNTLLSAKPWLLGLSAIFSVMPLLITSLRWWYLLSILDIHVGGFEVVRLTFLGQFFSFVVPGTVSGDLVKAWYVAKHTPRKAAVLVSVFIDRVIGLLEFAILPAVVMVVMLASGVGAMSRFRTPAIMVVVVLVMVAGSLSLLLSPGLRRMLRVSWLVKRLPMQKHLQIIAEAANLYRKRAGALFKALAITFGSQFFFIGAIFLAGLSLGLPVPWYQYFLYVPLIYIIAAIPISPGGLGVAETFYVMFFTPSGSEPWTVSASQILALALVARLIPMLVSLPGLVVAVTGPKRPKSSDMQAELEGGQASSVL